MNTLQERIQQFRKMANDDPDNELGHFRLGQLYMEAGDFAEAVKSFERTLELSPTFSKVFQLLGSCLIQLDRKAEAIETLKKGFTVAEERGDKMPRDEMARMLRELGEQPPQVASPQPENDGPATGFHCKRPTCVAGKRARQLDKPPLPDAIGERIHREICADCWNDWYKNFSIKVINELRLDLSTDFGQKEYDKYMYGFFGFEDELASTTA